MVLLTHFPLINHCLRARLCHVPLITLLSCSAVCQIRAKDRKLVAFLWLWHCFVISTSLGAFYVVFGCLDEFQNNP
jgi:hypothetical protein